MKKVILASILVVALSAGVSYAWGGGRGWNGGGGPCWGGGNGGNGGYGMMNQGMRGPGFKRGGMMGGGFNNPCAMYGGAALGSEQQQQFLDATVDLRREMSQKRFDYREAARNPATTPEQLAAIEKQIIDLQAQIGSKARALQPQSN